MRTAGLRTVVVEDDATGERFPMLVFSPASEPERCVRLGAFEIDVAPEAPPSAGLYPLVVISHGAGGSHFVHRTLARALASDGFIVGIPEHPGNNRNDNSLDGTSANLTNRPRQLRAAIDWFFADDVFSSHVEPHAVSIVGHSMGGYTALALAGGKPSSIREKGPDGKNLRIAVTRDPRVERLVLFAPATVWFLGSDALRDVTARVAIVAGDQDEFTPPFHAKIVLAGVPDPARVRYRLVPGAGHYSFLSPFPDVMNRPGFLPGVDPPGFDRAAFHRELFPEVIAFLREPA